jgi:hypothetical protein
MKLKKFFAGVLAAAMMLTVGATAAFATTAATDTTATPGTNSFADNITLDSTLTLTKHYNVVKGKAPLEDFKFDVTYIGSMSVETDVNYTGAKIPQKIAEFNADTTGATKTGLPVGNYSANFTIPMSELGLNSLGGTGIFVYKIAEENAGTPGVVYNTDGGALYMIVTVTHRTTGDDHQIVDGQYDYAVALRRASADATVVQALTGTKVSAGDAFHNTYGADNAVNAVNGVELKKTVHGNFGDLGKEFTFNVAFTKGADKNYGPITVDNTAGYDIYKAAENGEKGEKVEGTELEYGQTYIVTLKHDTKITFNNLPAGVTYTMTEKGKDAASNTLDGLYVVKGEQPNGTVSAGAEVDKVNIENTNEGSPDMGVVLDNAPYIAMLAIVAIGGVALMLNKRRRDEE